MTWVTLISGDTCCCGSSGGGLECNTYCTCTPQTISVTFTGISLCGCRTVFSRFDDTPPSYLTVARWRDPFMPSSINRTFSLSFTGTPEVGVCRWCATGGAFVFYDEAGPSFDCGLLQTVGIGNPVVTLDRTGTTAWRLRMFLKSSGPQGNFFDVVYDDISVPAPNQNCTTSTAGSSSDLIAGDCNSAGFAEEETCGATTAANISNYIMGFGGTATINGTC